MGRGKHLTNRIEGGEEILTYEDTLRILSEMARNGFRTYKEALRRAGLRPVKFHGLRHSFGTLAVQAFPLSDVQAWMGHRDIQTTMRYVHHVPKTDAAQRLGRLLDGENVAPNLASNAAGNRSPEGVEHA